MKTAGGGAPLAEKPPAVKPAAAGGMPAKAKPMPGKMPPVADARPAKLLIAAPVACKAPAAKPKSGPTGEALSTKRPIDPEQPVAADARHAPKRPRPEKPKWAPAAFAAVSLEEMLERELPEGPSAPEAVPQTPSPLCRGVTSATLPSPAAAVKIGADGQARVLALDAAQPSGTD